MHTARESVIYIFIYIYGYGFIYVHGCIGIKSVNPTHAKLVATCK